MRRHHARATLLLLLCTALTHACTDGGSTQEPDHHDTSDLTDTAPDLGRPDTAPDAPLDTAAPDLALDLLTETTEPDLPPPAPLLQRYLLDGDDLFPESVTFDPVSRDFFVGSLGQGNVHRIAGDGSGQSVFDPGHLDEPGWLTLGVEVDPMRRRLWVCAVFGTAMTRAEVWVLDLDTAQRIATIPLAAAHPDAVCNDLVIDAQGRAYVSDRQGPRVYLVDAQAQTATTFADSPLLEPENLGLNGVALSHDGLVLLAGKYSPPRLVRIPVDDPFDVAVVDLGEDDIAGALTGIDGITMLDGALYLTFELQLLRITPDDATWNRATVDALDVTQDGMAVAGLSGVTEAEGALYVSKSDVVRFALGVAPELPFRLLRVDPAQFDAP